MPPEKDDDGLMTYRKIKKPLPKYGTYRNIKEPLESNKQRIARHKSEAAESDRRASERLKLSRAQRGDGSQADMELGKISPRSRRR